MKSDSESSRLISTMIGVLVTAPGQRLLARVFAMEAQTHSRFDAKHIQKLHKLRDPDGLGGAASEPVAISMARGTAVDICILELSQLVDSDDSPGLRALVRSFRCVFGSPNGNAMAPPPTPTLLILHLWHAVLPGAAQIWYRVKEYWCCQLPFRLLHLLRADVTVDATRVVAASLLDAHNCCLAAFGGIALRLRGLALAHSDVRAEQINFVLGAYVHKLLWEWAVRLKLTIADLECLNARIKRFRVAGRNEKMGNTAAKGLVAEAQHAFCYTHGRPLAEISASASIRASEECASAGAGAPQAPGPLKGLRQ